MSNLRYGFHLASLAAVTYKKLKELMAKSELTQWEIVTLAIHMMWTIVEKKSETTQLGNILRTAREETRNLKPNAGKRHDAEWEKQTRMENGE